MRTLLLFVLSLSVPLAGGTFEPAQETWAWESTGVDLAFAQRFISTEFCNRTPENFRSCKEAFAQAEYLLKGKAIAALKALRSAKLEDRPDFSQLLLLVEKEAAEPALRALIYGSMVSEQLRTFDPHAGIMPVSTLNLLVGEAADEVIGVGLEYEVNGLGAFIRKVYPNSPASVAGLKVHDRLLSVQGRRVAPGLQAFRALKYLRLKRGAQIDLTIERAGQTYDTVLPVTRFPAPLAQTEILQTGKEQIALVTIRTFSEGTCALVARQLGFVAEKVKGAILDVRGNLGGAVEEATCIARLFLGEKPVLARQMVKSPLPPDLPLKVNQDADKMNLSADKVRPALWPTLKLVVLVDANSASASEILAAALQDHERAWIVGEVTNGKGTAQLVQNVPFLPTVLWVHTVSRNYRPNGTSVQLQGITPNFQVPVRELTGPLARQFPREKELYGTAFGPETTKQFQETRPADYKVLVACMKRTKLPQQHSTWHAKTFGFEDFQKATALAILNCQPG